jgi:hypothetical protein
VPVPGVINLNDSTPPARPGKRLVLWQADNNNPRNVSAEYASFGGVAVKTANYTAVLTDEGLLLSFSITADATLTLPATAPSTSWALFVENIGPGELTVSRNGRLIDTRAADLTLLSDQGIYIATDGTDYFTMRGIGPHPIDNEVPSGTRDGNNAVFTLSGTPLTNSLRLYEDGILQVLNVDYKLSGHTITFIDRLAGEYPNLAEGDTLRAWYRV